jgi:hypothetical protein
MGPDNVLDYTASGGETAGRDSLLWDAQRLDSTTRVTGMRTDLCIFKGLDLNSVAFKVDPVIGHTKTRHSTLVGLAKTSKCALRSAFLGFDHVSSPHQPPARHNTNAFRSLDYVLLLYLRFFAFMTKSTFVVVDVKLKRTHLFPTQLIYPCWIAEVSIESRVHEVDEVWCEDSERPRMGRTVGVLLALTLSSCFLQVRISAPPRFCLVPTAE